ncbi:transporter DctQ-related protein [Deltaproteobacteria bacterium]|nr:transporter DctQ-related protein [Deltaproteobacteria bacterium]
MQPTRKRITAGLKLITGVIDATNSMVGHVVAFLILPVLFFIMYEVVSRRFFNAPTIWAFEMIVMCFGAYVILTPGYGLLRGSLVCIDLVSKKFNPKTSHLILMLSYLLFFTPFVVCLLPACYAYALQSWTGNEMSWSAWAPPIYPLKMTIPIGWSLLCLQGLSEMLKSALALMNMGNGESIPIQSGAA